MRLGLIDFAFASEGCRAVRGDCALPSRLSRPRAHPPEKLAVSTTNALSCRSSDGFRRVAGRAPILLMRKYMSRRCHSGVRVPGTAGATNQSGSGWEMKRTASIHSRPSIQAFAIR